jgi:hypothetical protein
MRHLRLVAMAATERLQLFQGRPQLMLVAVAAGSAHQLGLLGLAVWVEVEQEPKGMAQQERLELLILVAVVVAEVLIAQQTAVQEDQAL